MLGKLFKYEYKSTARWMLPSYLFLLLMSLINMGLVARTYNNGVVFAYQPDSAIFNMIEGLLGITYFIAIVAVGMLTMFVAVTRFYKNLLSNEGYISLTLPVSIDEHLIVKLVTAISWIILSVLTIIISLCILTAPTGLFSELRHLPEALSYINGWLGGRLGLYIFNWVLNGLFAAVQAVLMLYFAMAIGQLSNNHKVGMAIVAYIGINFVMQIVSSIFAGTMFANLIMIEEDAIGVIEMLSRYGFIAMIWSIVMSAGFYFGTRYILTKRINLQ